MKDSKKIYLHLAIAQSGLVSRRKAEKLVREGRVEVNGKTVFLPEYKVEPDKDKIFVNGSSLKSKEDYVYFLLNKPKGVLSAVSDKRGCKTVIDLLPKESKRRIYPVGRLDKDTTGVLILTNDGELTYRLTHPKFKVIKTYSVVCRGKLGEKGLVKLEEGLEIDGKKTLAAKIRKVRFLKNKSYCLIEIFEGRKRQLKKMFLKIGHPVIELERIKYDTLGLGNLRRGEVRVLTGKEVEGLKKKTGLLK